MVRDGFSRWSAAAGMAMFLAYALVLAALRLAPAASVAAVRETSVVMATIIAAVIPARAVSRGGRPAPCWSRRRRALALA